MAKNELSLHYQKILANPQTILKISLGSCLPPFSSLPLLVVVAEAFMATFSSVLIGEFSSQIQCGAIADRVAIVLKVKGKEEIFLSPETGKTK